MTVDLHSDIYGKEVFADPYSYYGRLREEDPVHFNEQYGIWLITRYEDVAWMVRHPELFSSELYKRDSTPSPPIDESDKEHAAAVAEHRSHELIKNDPPEHTRLREPFRKPLSPKELEGWRQFIREAVASLLDRVADQGSMDVVADIGKPLPLLIVSEMLGVPPGDRQMLKEQAAERMLSELSVKPDRMRRAVTAIRDSSAYFDRLMNARADEPSSDLLGLLAQAEDEGNYSRGESVANAQGLLDAGHETTIQLLCNGTLAFLSNPEEWELFKTDPAGLAVTATEECLRYDPPLLGPRRVAAEDVELRGKTIKKGDRVQWLIAAANRDPREFENPDRFDIRRSPNRHISFGVGIHYCLGQYLARVEGQEVFTALATRFPNLRLATDSVEYADIRAVRSITSLPVAWD
jgi:cytochrome P450